MESNFTITCDCIDVEPCENLVILQAGVVIRRSPVPAWKLSYSSTLTRSLHDVRFTCRDGVVTSSQVYYKVLFPPEVTLDEERKDLEEGEPLNLLCEVVGSGNSAGNTTFEWMIDHRLAIVFSVNTVAHSLGEILAMS